MYACEFCLYACVWYICVIFKIVFPMNMSEEESLKVNCLI